MESTKKKDYLARGGGKMIVAFLGNTTLFLKRGIAS